MPACSAWLPEPTLQQYPAQLDPEFATEPPHAPELNPVERVWLYMRERFLSHRLHADHAAILDAACEAWNRLTPERLRSLTSYAWLPQVSS